jgi:hypothetical protein
MKFTRHIIALVVFLTHLFANSFGYLRQIEASFCMDACSQYSLEEEDGTLITFLANTNNIDLPYFINRYVEIEDGGEHPCVECSAMIIENIEISDDCDYPVMCFVDPCEVAPECELNIPVDCMSRYCDGCYADFYDLDGNLVDCYNTPDCIDLSGIFFGLCDMVLGIGYVNGECSYVSGCDWVVDGVDYSDAFFDSMEECEEACVDSSEPTCDEIQDQYSSLHSDIYISCGEDSDCISIWGDCDVGLGGCHYSINNELFDYEYSNDLVDQWVDGDCMQWVCDCMSLPNSICTNGQCDLTYCEGSNPAGCFNSGCQDGYECVDFGNSGYADFCVASSCVCDESYIYQSYWMCTEDCNGGTCVPETPQPGDLCIADQSTVGDIPGFVECDGQCVDYMYYEWIGDGWCDEGAWGITLNCEALDCDGGDCSDSWCGCIPGDTNGDATTDIIDIVLIIGCILDGDNSCSCSDVNHDGQINVIDIILIVDIIITP